MNRIVAISKYGFKVDSLKNQWEGVDKCLLKREVFLNLQKGDLIEVRERNKRNFIIDFTVLQRHEGGVNHLSNTQSLSTVPPSLSIPLGSSILEREEGKDCPPCALDNSKPSSVQDRIMYGQALNIAFENQSMHGLNLNYGDSNWVNARIDECLNIADMIYARMIKRCLR